MFTKTAVVALVACMVAAVVAGSAAMALRPAGKPQQVQQGQQAQPRQPQQAIGCIQTLPPITGTLPHYSLDRDASGNPIPLTYACQQEYVRQLNALGTMPTVVWQQNIGRWGYRAPDGHFQTMCYDTPPFAHPLPEPLPPDWFATHFYGQ